MRRWGGALCARFASTGGLADERRNRWFERILNTVADRGRTVGLRGRAEGHRSFLIAVRRPGSGPARPSNILLAREILQRSDLLDDGQGAHRPWLADEFGRTRIETISRGRGYDATTWPPWTPSLPRSRTAAPGTASDAPTWPRTAPRTSSGCARLLAGPRGSSAVSAVDADFRHLLASGILRLQRIDWRSPADIPERLMHHEAVHPDAGLGRPASSARRRPSLFSDSSISPGIAGGATGVRRGGPDRRRRFGDRARCSSRRRPGRSGCRRHGGVLFDQQRVGRTAWHQFSAISCSSRC